jgi:hypothetical protein
MHIVVTVVMVHHVVGVLGMALSVWCAYVCVSSLRSWVCVAIWVGHVDQACWLGEASSDVVVALYCAVVVGHGVCVLCERVRLYLWEY